MNFWKKLKLLFAQRSDSDSRENDDEIIFKTSEPVDVLFTKNFIAGGGQFFYCENEQEVLANLQDIIYNEQIKNIICFDDKLKSLLNRLNVKHTSKLNEAEFSFIECEYLAAYDGAIMLSSHQTMGRVLSSFPDNFIIYAHPRQLVSNIGEGMQRIKSSKKDNFPSNITSIRGRNMHDFDAIPNAKNIFLLLAEEI